MGDELGDALDLMLVGSEHALQIRRQYRRKVPRK